MNLDCFRRTLETVLHGYQVNYEGLQKSGVTYLSKNRDFSLFQVNLPPELTFLYLLRQQNFFLMTQNCFRRTLGTIFHGNLVNYGGMYNSVVTYLLKNHDFSSFQVNLPPELTFCTPQDPIKGSIHFTILICISLSNFTCKTTS